jgi:hypothetical protein
MSLQFMFLTASQPFPTATFACPTFSPVVVVVVLLLGWGLEFIATAIGRGGGDSTLLPQTCRAG